MLRGWHAIAGCRRVASWDLVTGSHGTSGISSTAIVACSGVRSVRVPRIFRLNACHSVAWVRAHWSVTSGIAVSVHVVGTSTVGGAFSAVRRDVHTGWRESWHRPDSRPPAEIDRLVRRREVNGLGLLLDWSGCWKTRSNRDRHGFSMAGWILRTWRAAMKPVDAKIEGLSRTGHLRTRG